MSKEGNKKDKKKLAILILLLFAVVGIAGYGVYSYYWTEGDFIGKGSTIDIAAFDPQTTINDNTDFLGSGGTLKITCPDSTTGNDNLTCTGTVLVSNNGDTDITVEVLDAESGKYDNSAAYFDINVSNPSFSWTTKTISAGDSSTLSIDVPVSVTSDYGSSNPVNAGSSSIETSGYWGVDVKFKLKATQVHN